MTPPTQSPSLVRLALWSCASWAVTLLLYFSGIVVAAALLQYAPTSTASTAAFVLVAAQFIVACMSIAFVYIRARGHFQSVLRFVWIALFAVLQLATCVLAVLATLLVLNR